MRKILIKKCSKKRYFYFRFSYFKQRNLHNRIFFPLLANNAVIVVIELPITLIYLHNGFVPSKNICTGWIVLNSSLFLLSITLMGWASVERYLFIYHERIIIRHYVLLHGVPILCLLLYCPLFYLGAVVLHKCQSDYDVYQYVCGGACYQHELALGMIDWIGNVLCVVFFTFVVNLILIIRHAMQRNRMKRCIFIAGKNQQWVRTVMRSFSDILRIHLSSSIVSSYRTHYRLFCLK
jgi:hypothetical protein